MIGSTRDEMYFFTVQEHIPQDLTEAAFDATALSAGLSAAELASMKRIYRGAAFGGSYPYPPLEKMTSSEWYWLLVRSGTDAVSGLGACSVKWAAGLLVQGGSPAVYTYLFAHPPSVRKRLLFSQFSIRLPKQIPDLNRKIGRNEKTRCFPGVGRGVCGPRGGDPVRVWGAGKPSGLRGLSLVLDPGRWGGGSRRNCR